MRNRMTALMVALLVGASIASAQEIVPITDASIQPGQNVTFTNDKVYVLDGFVFVDSTATLTIQAGTVIKAKAGEGANASALIVARGGKIFANGTKDQPIIFTAEVDDLNDPSDLTAEDRGLWGGLIILGNATLNVAGGTEQIEGIPVNEPRGAYGGTNDDDNSGVLRYVSVRHGGSNIGANNEINGVTFGGVGRETIVDHIEVFANADDGYEWFGGTVNCKYLVSAFNGDDSFDWDEGFRGMGQFWFAIQDAAVGNSLFESDGGTTPEDGEPYATPMLYNITAIGSGSAGANAKNTPLINLRDNSGGFFYNSIIADGRGFAINVEDLESGEDSRSRLQNNDMAFKNNIWFGFTSGIADVANGQQFLVDYLTNPANVNNVVDPQFASISRVPDRMLDPRVQKGSPAFSSVMEYPDSDFLSAVNYRGAFDANNLWAKEWTAIDEQGYLVSNPANIVNITDGDILPGQNITWTADNTYILDGFVFVDSTATLTIEAGTVIKGKPGEGANASALIVARGGKIFANGTVDQPIIFTAEVDDLSDPEDLTQEDRGLWGGLILLGSAGINVAGGEEQIEGIPVTEPRGRYGGTNDEDNSGSLRFVSVRHGGSNIGANNEINGVTFGGVGSGTVVDFIEVFANADDGYEWFGGTVNTKHLVSAFNGDDSFDWDEGFRGKGQFWFAIMDANLGNSAFENDGGTTPEDGEPYATPMLYNITAIGSGSAGTNAKNTPLINLRDNSGGFFYNSIFMDGRGYAVNVEDLASGEDSRSRLENNDMAFNNNIWHSFSSGIADANNGQQFLLDYLTAQANVNDVVDPMINGVSREPNKELDPRVGTGSPALQSTKALPDGDGFFETASYRGAFDSQYLWIKKWTLLDDAGYVVDLPAGTETITDASIQPGDNVRWTSNNTYILDGFVFVDSTATLTIDPGTVIKGKPGEGANASALIVARGGKIFANGTKDNPIVFTALADDVSDPDDLTQDDRGLWGGLILLGSASINVAGGEEQIEGIPVTEPRGRYGGTNDADNSGSISYISVRHGGSNIGANNEINGVTFGGVGSGTDVHHLEVFANADDGYEWFGGTVNTKYLVSAFNGDDGFDWDEGFRGKGQFWFVIQSATVGNSAFECDGGTTPEDGTPYAIPVLSNITVIGSGKSGANAKNTPLLNLRDNSGGKFYNSIFMDGRGFAVNVEDLASGQDSRQRLEDGDLVFENNIWFDFTSGVADVANGQQFLVDYLTNQATVNEVVDPMMTAISRTEDAMLDPRPAAGSPAFGNIKDMGDAWYTTTDYRGAFGSGPGSNWVANWTFIWDGGLVTSVNEEVIAGVDAKSGLVFPNPASTNAVVRFTVTNSLPVSISIVNATGTTVATVAAGETFPMGINEVSIETADFASGAYMVVITGVDGAMAVPFSIIR